MTSLAEEILGSNSAIWFSPDGGKVAYASLNDSLVETVAIPQYDGSNHQQYPTMRNLRYPKVSRLYPALAYVSACRSSYTRA